jgi:hypothetical protein
MAVDNIGLIVPPTGQLHQGNEDGEAHVIHSKDQNQATATICESSHILSDRGAMDMAQGLRASTTIHGLVMTRATSRNQQCQSMWERSSCDDAAMRDSDDEESEMLCGFEDICSTEGEGENGWECLDEMTERERRQRIEYILGDGTLPAEIRDCVLQELVPCNVSTSYIEQVQDFQRSLSYTSHFIAKRINPQDAQRETQSASPKHLQLWTRTLSKDETLPTEVSAIQTMIPCVEQPGYDAALAAIRRGLEAAQDLAAPGDTSHPSPYEHAFLYPGIRELTVLDPWPPEGSRSSAESAAGGASAAPMVNRSVYRGNADQPRWKSRHSAPGHDLNASDARVVTPSEFSKSQIRGLMEESIMKDCVLDLVAKGLIRDQHDAIDVNDAEVFRVVVKNLLGRLKSAWEVASTEGSAQRQHQLAEGMLYLLQGSGVAADVFMSEGD